MQDARKELEYAVRWQIMCLQRLNKAATDRFVNYGSPWAEAEYHEAVAECKEADALVAYWRAVCRGKVSLS